MALFGAMEVTTDDGSIYTTAYRDGSMRMRVVTDDGQTAEVSMNLADCRDLREVMRDHVERHNKQGE